ncbi:unnamed protein product [Closterium sp. NIES-65]|nr:unnamed protein product [Closterium sp. NIES-65]CAI5963921.1 unnamed protein product [Closterium sp. NIES-65]
MEHRGRSALRRLAALTLAAGLVALAVLVAPTTASNAYFPPYPFAPSNTGIYVFSAGGPERITDDKVLTYDDALCASVPQGGNRFAKGAVVKVRWDTIGFKEYSCARLTFHRTPRCGGPPYLALVRPDRQGAPMSSSDRRAMLTRRFGLSVAMPTVGSG